MASPFDADVPPWLLPKKSPADYFAQGQEIGSQIASNIIRARSLQMQSEEQAAQIGNIMATTELKRQQLQEQNQENAAWMKVAEPVSKWLATPDKQLSTIPTPDPGTSEKAAQLIEKRQQAKEMNDYRRSLNDIKQQQADNQLDVAEIRTRNNTQAAKDKKEWSDAFNRLTKENRSALFAQYPDLVDKDGVPLPKYHGLINDALESEKQSKIGAPKPGTAGGQPEFFTDPQTNRRFMRWGTKHYDLSGVTPQQRAEIDVAKGDYSRAQRAYDKAIENKEKESVKESLLQNIFTTRDNLNNLIKGAPVSAAPQEKPSTKADDPLNLFK